MANDIPTPPWWQHGVLDPHGPIAAAERTILFDATAIMLAVVVPTVLMALAFAWWFRAGNPWARRSPDWAYSGAVELTVWSIPLLVVLFLGGIGWLGAHELDPSRRIASGARPLEVQVVALDWRWLFIYPDEGVASVGRLVVPAGVPLHLRLTSASVMNSFFVPQLGSQVYAMGGMATTLDLEASHPGTYPGLSAQFSGDGFSDMRFDAVAVAPAAFADWLAQARTGAAPLDAAAFARLALPAHAGAPASFAPVAPRLFDDVVVHTASGTPWAS